MTMASAPSSASPPPPAGLTSEFAKAPGPLFDTTIGLRTVAVVVTTVFIVIRIITRRDMGKFEMEDFMLILAYIFNIAKNVVFIALANEALDASPMVIAQESYALELLYIVVLFCAKCAMLFQLRRTFTPWKSGPIYIMYCVLLWFNVAFTVTSVVGMIIQCTPIQKMWDPSITWGHCVDRGAAIIVSAVFNLGSDVAIFLLPLWSIWHLKKTRQYKLSVAAVFATAALAIGASVGRTVETITLRAETSDVTSHFAETGLWSCAETALLIMCPCFLFMPRFVMIVRGQPRPAPMHYEASIPRQLAHRRWWRARGPRSHPDPKAPLSDDGESESVRCCCNRSAV